MAVTSRAPRGVHCEIVIKGSVKSNWLDQLSELTLSDAQTETGTVSLLRGNVADQAALLGVLNGLDGLGLALLSISCQTIEPHPAG